MEKRIANILSFITHPLLMPMLGLIVIVNSGTYAADLDKQMIQILFISVFILTLLLPSGLIPLFYFAGIARNIQFTERRERLIPLYITFILYAISFFVLRKLPVSQVYLQFVFAAVLVVLVVLIISHFWKVSTHLAGCGGLIGLIVSLSLKFEADLMVFLIIGLLLTGCVGFARLRLNAHNTLQIYTGFGIGVATMLTVFFV
jgi:membrane-associated phospholipid phosphatase